MVQLRGYLNVIEAGGNAVRLSSMDVQESYESGWRATALITSRSNTDLDLVSFLRIALISRVSSGTSATVLMSLDGADPRPPPSTGELPPGSIVRLWPSIVSRVEPLPPASEAEGSRLMINLVDPVSYVSNIPIWGAYRLCSAAEMIGGAISMAGGGDGKPTLTPHLQGLATVRIINNLREELDIIPYSVAAGETLGIWLNRMRQTLGIRSEIVPNLDGSIEVILSDRPPSGRPLRMQLTVNRNPDDDTSDAPNGQLYISKIEGLPGQPNRSVVLDDPLYGSFSRIGGTGSVGNIENSPGIDVNEATRRANQTVQGIFVNMLRLHVKTRQSAIRPGRLLQFGQAIAGISSWQASSVLHHLRGNGWYLNDAVLVNGEIPWLSETPENIPPTYATALVDGGNQYSLSEPVPRDRLGRISVRLSFLPTPQAGELEQLAAADDNEDGRITLSDFEEEELEDYRENARDWMMKVAAYRRGEYEDAFPGQADKDLTEEELAQREADRESRRAVVRYLASRRAEQHDLRDRDRDNYISSRDEVISDELSVLLDEPGARGRLNSQLEAREQGTLMEDFPPEEVIDDSLLDEYKALFVGGPEEGEDEYRRERRAAQVVQERWPPRIPVSAIEPMAGGLHGFIPGHRQGDTCRVLIHHPLFIELAGYQYRADQPISESIVDAHAGMVVEHNQGDIWSGILFKPLPEEESEDSEDEESES